MITALVGLAVTPGPALSLTQVFALALSVLVASASAGAFNQYFESDSDGLMARTRTRAFVTGALPRSRAWLLLIAAMVVGAVALAWTALIRPPPCMCSSAPSSTPWSTRSGSNGARG